MVYLCDVVDGGCTFFPKAVPCAAADGGHPASGLEAATDSRLPAQGAAAGGRGGGIRVNPRKGRLLLFWSVKNQSCEDENSLHAAEEVIRGEKWIMTKWFKALPPSAELPKSGSTDSLLAASTIDLAFDDTCGATSTRDSSNAEASSSGGASDDIQRAAAAAERKVITTPPQPPGTPPRAPPSQQRGVYAV